jgi:hypothetical protein
MKLGGDCGGGMVVFVQSCDRLELNGREMTVARDCMLQVTYILVFYSNISKPLIIFEIDLMVNKNGRPVNHLIDGPP